MDTKKIECNCNCEDLINKIQADALKLRSLKKLLREQEERIEYISTKHVFYKILPN
ncbi:MAG: hypothetical protein K0S44_1888 [Bacteroidetes bacterium]|jgi:hypothetical protein|nr:hypothetical protein [Bacteroidota bacterium]